METATGKNPVKLKRSVALDDADKILLASHIANYKKPVEAAIALGIDRNTMQRVALMGSGAEASIITIRENLRALYQ